MDRIFDADARRFDEEVREQENEYKSRGLCPDCGRPVDKDGCEECSVLNS